MDNVYVIADSSGKMSELGKDHLQNYVLRAAASLLNSGEFGAVNAQLLAWGRSIEPLEEPEVPEFGGRADTQLLASAFSDMDTGTCILLVSDGNFDCDSIRQAATDNALNIVSVYIGADACVCTMDDLSSSGHAMPAEDIAAAVSLLCSYIGKEEQ